MAANFNSLAASFGKEAAILFHVAANFYNVVVSFGKMAANI